MARWGKEEVVVLEVRSLDQHHQETWKCRFLGPYQTSWMRPWGLWGWGRYSVLTCSPGESDAHPNSRIKSEQGIHRRAFWAELPCPPSMPLVPGPCLSQVRPVQLSPLPFLIPSLSCTVHTQGQRHASLSLFTVLLWLPLAVFSPSFHLPFTYSATV